MASIDYFAPTTVSALGGQSIPSSRMMAGGGGDFLQDLNEELAAAGVDPASGPEGRRNIHFRHQSDGSSTLGQEDMAALRNILKKRGLLEEDLASLDQVLQNSSPLTIGGLMGKLCGQGRTSGELSDEESEGLLGALRSLGLGDDDAQHILGLMQEGNGYQAMIAINKHISGLGDDAAVNLNQDELAALARGLEISDDRAKAMLAQLSGEQNRDFNRDGLLALMSDANDELSRREKSLELVLGNLRPALDDMLQSARIRKSIEPVSDSRGSRRTQRAEARMRDDLTARAQGLGEDGKGVFGGLMDDDEINASLREETGRQHRDEGREREAGEENLRGKARVADNNAAKAPEAARTRSADSLEGRLTGEGVFSALSGTDASSPDQTAARRAAFEQAVFTQVEKGILQQLTDGSHRMVLQLNPDDMGTVTLLLTVRGSEVRAILRADNEETAAALNQQIAQLRQSLEDQGLKVAELEVENRATQDFASQDWTGMDSYNQQQELREQARLMQLARMRREAGDGLARNMQNTSVEQAEPEYFSASGLHVVA